MAAETIDLTTDKDTRRSNLHSGAIYRKDAIVNLATVLAGESDGTYEAGDVFQVIDVGAGTRILGGGIEIVDVVTGASAATFDLDVAAGDDIADGVDATSAGYGAAGSNGVLGFTNAIQVTTADTVDLKLVTLTGTLTGGRIRCFVWLADLDGPTTEL